MFFIQYNAGCSSAELTVEEKMEKAEKNLDNYSMKMDKLLDEMNSVKSSQDKVIKLLRKYTRSATENANNFNRLQLPCPGSAEAKDPANEGYVEWSRGYYKRSKEVETNINQKLNRILDAAGIQRH